MRRDDPGRALSFTPVGEGAPSGCCPMSGHRRRGRGSYRPITVVRGWERVTEADEQLLLEEGWERDKDGLLRKPPRQKPPALSPVTRGRLAEKLEAHLPEGHGVDFYRRKLATWKTRTPKEDILHRQALAKAVYVVTRATRKRHVYCLLLGIDSRRFDRLKSEGRELVE
jgi:hypothetical protein